MHTLNNTLFLHNLSTYFVSCYTQFTNHSGSRNLVAELQINDNQIKHAFTFTSNVYQNFPFRCVPNRYHSSEGHEFVVEKQQQHKGHLPRYR